jgi:2'-5' RNA ligase
VEISSSKNTRFFLALPVDEIYYDTLIRLQSELALDLAHLPHAIRWTKPARLHLTLFFLGRHSSSSIERLIKTMEQTNFSHLSQNIDFPCTQIQLFPQAKPTVVALTGKKTSASLMFLRKQVADCLKRAKIEPDLSPETQGFLPHITLGKIEEPTDFKTQPIEIAFNFNQLVLFKSEPIEPPRFPYVTHTPIHSCSLSD